MNFFKSVLADEPTPPDSPDSSPPPEPSSSSGFPDLGPTRPEASSSAWSFNALIKTLATKSESMIETYRKDLGELGSGLKMETAVIREVASRAVKDLPASLEAGAGVAQVSLESVGQAIDDIGSTVWKSTAQIIGKDSILFDHDWDNNETVSTDRDEVTKQRSLDGLKRYSRFEMQLRELQGNSDTYCKEPEEEEEYEKWKDESFVLEGKRGEMEKLVSERDGLVRDMYNELVRGEKVDEELFWSRYFYRVHKLKQAEEARAMLVKRAISGEEEELSWEIDNDDDGGGGDGKIVSLLKGESSGTEEVGMEVKNVTKVDNGDGKEDSKVKNVENVIEKDKFEDLSDGVDKGDDKFEDKVVEVEGKGEYDDSGRDSDLSVVSRQSLLPEEEDLGWDEIEDIGSSDGSKGYAARGSTTSTGRADLRKRLSAAEEEEDLSWDIDDEDDEPVKP